VESECDPPVLKRFDVLFQFEHGLVAAKKCYLIGLCSVSSGTDADGFAERQLIGVMAVPLIGTGLQRLYQLAP